VPVAECQPVLRPAASEVQLMADYNAEHKSVLDDLFKSFAGVRPGKMFGCPAYYAGDKLCVCLYGEGVGVKLPADSAARLLREDPNVTSFQPMGKPQMREWVQINLERSEDYRRYEPVFAESIDFVRSVAGRKR
jgi:hypothetical protein